MHDIRAIRENPAAFDATLARRGLAPLSDRILSLDADRRARIVAADYYAPESDRGIRWNDETIGITWPEIDSEILTSAKDSVAKSFPDAEYF